MAKNYVPLHLHTANGSIGDSIIKNEDLIKKLKELNIHSVAITDHGSLSNIYSFYKDCVKENIKPILGCEVYEVDKQNSDSETYHLVLLARNNIGLQNLISICNDAYLNGFHTKPKTDIEKLKKYGEGIIALTACVQGKIPSLFKFSEYLSPEEFDENIEKAKKHITEYQSIFDEVYLEIQPGKFDEQNSVNQNLIFLAQETGCKLVITSDVHYINQEDYLYHDFHIKMDRNEKIDVGIIYPDICYYLQSYEEMRASFTDYPENIILEALENTNLIADQCNVSFDSSLYNMPIFPCPDNLSADDYLNYLAYEALKNMENKLDNPFLYSERLEKELSVINQLNFSGYFLTVQDFIRFAKNNDIPIGPGRGSAVGCLVSYLIGISEIDPIKYNLLFERFLSAHRSSAPDIDIDIADTDRQKMFDYIKEKYGEKRCALVSTRMLRKTRTVLRDTARLFDINKSDLNAVLNEIPDAIYEDNGDKTTNITISDLIDIFPQIKQYAEKYPKWFDAAQKLSGLPKSASIHPAGVLISPYDLNNTLPLIRANSGMLSTSLPLQDVEFLKFTKFDFLGLANLRILHDTEKDVNFKFDTINDEFNDEATWDLIGSENTISLFQIGSKTYRSRMSRLKPKTIDELASCIALIRTPCISAKLDEDYMRIVEGRKEIKKIHPIYDNITAYTNGILIYQEDLMHICQAVGMSLDDGYNIVKASSKKNKAVLEKYHDKFIEFALKKDMPIEAAEHIFKILLDSSKYSFNRSHAVAYAIICYKSAYYKTHYPLNYMAHTLTNAYLRGEEIYDTIKECHRLNIEFLPLDINKSDYKFTVEDGKIRFGMCAIKDFGANAVAQVLKIRPFASFKDFINKTDKSSCNKKSITAGIFSGLFDSFNSSRLELYKEFAQIRKHDLVDTIKTGKDEISIYASNQEFELAYLSVPGIAPKNLDVVQNNGTYKLFVSSMKNIFDKNGKEMAFVKFESGDGFYEAVIFASNYSQMKDKIKVNTIQLLTIEKSSKSFIIKDVEDINEGVST